MTWNVQAVGRTHVRVAFCEMFQERLQTALLCKQYTLLMKSGNRFYAG